MVAAVRAAVRELAPALAVFDVQMLSSALARQIWAPRTLAVLLAVFATLALALAAMGVYGVTAYLVARRHREIGIRMALGARGSDVVGLVMRRGLRLAAAGVALGLLGTFAIGRVLSRMLGVTPTDPPLVLVAVTVLVAATALATLFPALRGTQVDPAVALRNE